MLTLLSLALVPLIAGMAIAAFAAITAKDGYEDDLGFHAGAPSASSTSVSFSNHVPAR